MDVNKAAITAGCLCVALAVVAVRGGVIQAVAGQGRAAGQAKIADQGTPSGQARIGAGQENWVELAVHNFGAPINTMWAEGELSFADDGTMVYTTAGRTWRSRQAIPRTSTSPRSTRKRGGGIPR